MRVLDVQALASVQDLGRVGYRSQGLGQAGAMDALALKTGNLLLNNDENAAAIEVAMGGMVLEFEHDTPFCLTGAFYEAHLNHKPVYSYWRYTAKKGQRLTLIRAKRGLYGYICVQGGIQTPKLFDSRSTDIRAQIGGVEGRYLRVGDELPTQVEQEFLSEIAVAPIELRQVIYAIPSSEYRYFSEQSHQRFWQSAFVLQSQSDRMGFRLKGDGLELSEPLEMLSHAIPMGTVQVPPDGQPIVLMRDAQTTGGYAKIACVLESELGRLAQTRFGMPIQFQWASVEKIAHLRKQDTVYLRQIKMIAESNKP
ncbi:MAG: biotin-dependent carboxyltransferase family protein [Cardiobacteriaceae bacterium]|nr:biotin-dependent carboxyltransferase family protein [Cardiobacteriaceae bacterium]